MFVPESRVGRTAWGPRDLKVAIPICDFCPEYLLIPVRRMTFSGHRRAAWGIQGGRIQLQAARPAGRSPLKRLLGRFRGGPPVDHRRVWHGEP
jgi:hypothetical protein